MSKTLGQVLREPLIESECGSTQVRFVADEAWESAAREVRTRVLISAVTALDEGVDHVHTCAAVIEAAKALVHEQRHGDESSAARAEWTLVERVTALEEQEQP